MKYLFILLSISCLSLSSCKDDTTTEENNNTVPKMRIISATLNLFPITDNGAAWDADEVGDAQNPDIYLVLSNEVEDIIYSFTKTDVMESSAPTYFFSWILFRSTEYTFRLVEDDGMGTTADPEMVRINFTPDDFNTNGDEPEFITITSGSDTSVVLEVIWE